MRTKHKYLVKIIFCIVSCSIVYLNKGDSVATFQSDDLDRDDIYTQLITSLQKGQFFPSGRNNPAMRVGGEAGTPPVGIDDDGISRRVDRRSGTVSFEGRTRSFGTDSVEPDTSAAIWQVKRIAIVGNETITQFANDGKYDQIWDDRTTFFPELPFTNSFSTSFDGVNDHVKITDHMDFDFGSAMTAACWIKGSAQLNANFFANWDAGTAERSWRMRSDSGGSTDKLQVILSDDGSAGPTHVKNYISSIAALTGDWKHIAFTWGANTLKLYINGVEDTSVTKVVDDAITSLHNSTADLTIGAALTSGAPLTPFAGNLDECALFNVALTATDISNLYNAGNPADLNEHAKAAALVSWWRMGDVSTFPTIEDSSEAAGFADHTGDMLNMDAIDFELDVP